VTRARVRVALADDHEIFRDGLRGLLESEPLIDVVGEAADGYAAARLVREVQPDVLLLDVAMPKMGGFEALSSIAEGPTRILLLTAGIDRADLLRAIRLGARGVVLKEAATRELIEAIFKVMDGKYIIDENVADELAHAVHGVRTPRFGLTPRELDIVKAIVAGASNKEIADSLRISPQTVKHHLTSIFEKTSATSRLELALLAIRHGIVDSSGG
jgi:DNA-binding NarL/FixJ family response regulator